MNRNTTMSILILLVVLGAIFRFAGLGTNSFVADEFLDINSAYGYHQTRQWHAWDFNFGEVARLNENAARDERAFIYKWQVAEVFTFFPPIEAAARSVSVLWGVISIAVVFWSALVFTRSREIGLLAAFLCAVSVSAIILSRRLRMYAMFFPLYLAAATTWYAFYEREYQGTVKSLKTIWKKYGVNALYFFPALLLSISSYAVHQLTPHLFLVLGCYLVAQAALAGRSGTSWKNKYALSVGVGVLGVAALFLVSPKTIAAFTSGLVFFDDHISYIGYVFADFATPVIGVVISLVGIGMLRKKFKLPREALYLGLSLALPLFMAIFLWRRNAGPQYIYAFQSFVMILSAAGVYGVFSLFRVHFPTVGRRGLWILVLSGALLIPNWAYFLQENNTYHETSSGGNPNYRKVFAYFKKEKQPGDVLITRNFRNYYWSGARVPVFDFGGELSREKLSLQAVQQIMTEHPSGWFIYSGNDEDYIASDLERYAEKNMERISNPNVRGDITVFRWGG